MSDATSDASDAPHTSSCVFALKSRGPVERNDGVSWRTTASLMKAPNGEGCQTDCCKMQARVRKNRNIAARSNVPVRKKLPPNPHSEQKYCCKIEPPRAKKASPETPTQCWMEPTTHLRRARSAQDDH